MTILQRRVSHQPSNDGYAWIDMITPNNWNGTIEGLTEWLLDNSELYTDTVFRIIQESTHYHIEV